MAGLSAGGALLMTSSIRRSFVSLLVASGLGAVTVTAVASGESRRGDPASADVAIVGATLIDGTGAAPRASTTLLLRGDRIVAIGTTGDLAVPTGAHVIDATGKTVIPGLADMHVHFSFGAPAQRQPDETRQVLARQLYYGVTSILQLGATDGSTESIRALRAEREAGSLVAPHIYGSGGHLTLPGTHPVYTIFPPAAREAADRITAATPVDEPVNLYPMGLGISFVRNEASVRKAVAERAAGGMDVIKITVESGPLAFGDTHPLMSVDMIRTIVDEAGKHGLPVFAHVSSPAELQASLEGGAAGVVHAVIDRPLPSEATADLMAKRGFHVVPTLALSDGAVRFADEPGYMDDPFFRASVTDAELAALRAPGFAGAFREGWGRNANDPARAARGLEAASRRRAGQCRHAACARRADCRRHRHRQSLRVPRLQRAPRARVAGPGGPDAHAGNRRRHPRRRADAGPAGRVRHARGGQARGPVDPGRRSPGRYPQHADDRGRDRGRQARRPREPAADARRALTQRPMTPLDYLAGYPQPVLDRVHALIAQGRLGEVLAAKYGQSHAVRTDGQLRDYVQALKDRHLRMSVPLAKVVYDGKLQVLQNALGTHTAVSRVQGGRLKASREIRIATVFRDAPAGFLRMIVVHELAHLKEANHGKAFYQLCTHMEPDYHQLELDMRLYLTHLELRKPG